MKDECGATEDSISNESQTGGGLVATDPFRYERYWLTVRSLVHHQVVTEREGLQQKTTPLEAQQTLRVSQPVVPSGALVFKFPRGLAWMMLGCSLLCFGLVAIALVFSLIKPWNAARAIELPLVSGLGLFGALNLQSFGRLRDSVAANSDGIWYLPRKGESSFMSWCEVASVTANDTQQRLVLTDATGGRTIRLEYQLEDFGRLRAFVLSHTAAPTHQHASAVNVFHRNWVNKGILLSCTAFFLFSAWLCQHQGQPGPALFFMAFAALALLAIPRDPLRLKITREAILIEYPGWKRSIPFDAVSRIALKDVHNRGNVWAAVVVERRQGRPIMLFRFREGSVALHDALQSAWQSAGGDHESVGPK